MSLLQIFIVQNIKFGAYKFITGNYSKISVVYLAYKKLLFMFKNILMAEKSLSDSG